MAWLRLILWNSAGHKSVAYLEVYVRLTNGLRCASAFYALAADMAKNMTAGNGANTAACNARRRCRHAIFIYIGLLQNRDVYSTIDAVIHYLR